MEQNIQIQFDRLKYEGYLIFFFNKIITDIIFDIDYLVVKKKLVHFLEMFVSTR